MKKYTISIQNGLENIQKRLIEEGHTVVPYDQAGLSANVVIITGVHSEYEEIETAQCRKSQNNEEILLINASKLGPDDVMKFIDSHMCNI